MKKNFCIIKERTAQINEIYLRMKENIFKMKGKLEKMNNIFLTNK